MTLSRPFICDRKKIKATKDAPNARYIGPSKDESGNSLTMSNEISGPISDESEIEEASSPAAVARSLFRSSMSLSDPT